MKIVTILQATMKNLKSWALIPLFLIILGLGLDDFLMRLFQEKIFSPEGAPSWIWLVAGSAILNSMLYPLLVSFLIVNLGFLNAPPKFKEFEQLLIESLRAWGKSLWWGFLFIIPGFLRLLTYLFVPFVVLVDERYKSGSVEALKESSRLVRKSFGSVILTYFAYVSLSAVLSLVFKPTEQALFAQPLDLMLWGSLEFVLSILYLAFLFIIYQRSKNEQPDVSMA